MIEYKGKSHGLVGLFKDMFVHLICMCPVPACITSSYTVHTGEYNILVMPSGSLSNLWCRVFCVVCSQFVDHKVIKFIAELPHVLVT
jgi:hypothetical protein